MFLVSPYVIFGQKMEERKEMDNPWTNCIAFSSNRFIYQDPKGMSIRNIMNHQIFGFNCYYTAPAQGYEVTQGLKTTSH
jgi:hypothetical protein